MQLQAVLLLVWFSLTKRTVRYIELILVPVSLLRKVINLTYTAFRAVHVRSIQPRLS